MAREFIIEKLQTAGCHQVSRFRMSDHEDKPLQSFIRQVAGKSSKASIAKTYVAHLPDCPKVIGYITLMCAEVSLEGTYQIADKPGADRWPYQPAVRIAKLAVTDEYRGLGIGVALIELIIGLILEAIEPHVGCRFIILDAKTKSVGFYQRRGFRLLDTQANLERATRLMFLDLKAIAESA